MSDGKKDAEELLFEGGELYPPRVRGIAGKFIEHKEDYNYKDQGCIPVNVGTELPRAFARGVIDFLGQRVEGDLWEFLRGMGELNSTYDILVEYYEGNPELQERFKAISYWCKDGNILKNVHETEKAGESPQDLSYGSNDSTNDEKKGSDSAGDDSSSGDQSSFGASRYPQLYDVGVVDEEGLFKMPTFKGVALAFIRNADEIYGEDEKFDIDWVKRAFLYWGHDKFGDEWIRLITEHLDEDIAYDAIGSLYVDHDEFNRLAHEKYVGGEELEPGNRDTDDVLSAITGTEVDAESGNDGDDEQTETEETPRNFNEWAEQEGTADGSRDATNGAGRSRSGGSRNSDSSVGTPREANGEEREGALASSDDGASDSGGRSGEDRGRQSEDSVNGKPVDFQGWAEREGTTESVERSTSTNGDSGVQGSEETEEEAGHQHSGQAEGSGSEAEGVQRGDDESPGGGQRKGDGKLNRFAEKYGTTSSMGGPDRERKVNEVIHGNSNKVLRKLPKGYVDVCVTSPPYWALRDYEGDVEDDWDDGEWHGQLGHEPTPELFVNHLADIFDGVHRVLKPGGACWVNIADTYGGASGGFWEDEDYDGGNIGHGENRVGLDMGEAVPNKCLARVPQKFAEEMVQRGWILRNKVIWAKQVVDEDDNAFGATLPTAAKDRVIEKSAEMFYFFVKQPDYYFDLDSIRRPHKTQPGDGSHYGDDAKMTKTENHGGASHDLSRDFDEKEFYSEGGANIPRVWQVQIARKSEEHYAGFPENLVRRPIKACCPDGGIVMDPFTGSGTTLKVAEDEGKNWLGIEMSEKYVEIARNNVTGAVQSKLI